MLLRAGFHDLLGGLLQRRIERGVDAQPALREARPAESLDELAADLLLEVEAEASPSSRGRSPA